MSSQVPWISLVPPVEGQGDGSVGYTVGANPAASARRGALVVGSQSTEITQEAAPCRFELDRRSFELGAAEGAGEVGVRAPAGCAWSARSEAAWITIVEGAQGSGTARARFRVSPNPTIEIREGSLEVAGVRVHVRQLGTLAACRFDVDPPDADVGPEAREGRFAVATESVCRWTAVSEAAWLTVLDGEDAGPGDVRYRVDANASTTPRSGSIVVGGTSFTVRQTACSYSLQPLSASYQAVGGTGRVDVLTQSPCPWSAETTDSWILLTSGTSRTGAGRVTYTIAPNTRTTARTGHIAVAGERVTIVQDAAISLSGRVRSLEGSCPNRRFTVNGQRIRTTSATDYESGTCGDLAEGVPVRLKGLLGTDGVLTAFEVDF